MDLTQRPVANHDVGTDVRTGRRAPGWALVAGVVLAAVNLRTAVTSVGPLLDQLESGVGLTSTLAGVLTTLPVISFATLGSLTPRLAHRVGEQRLLAGALTMIIFTYAFVNMGMVSGILPVVGVPLPFISYGGTAMVTLGLAVGILMSIAKAKRLVQS